MLQAVVRFVKLARAVWALGPAERLTLVIAIAVAVVAGVARTPDPRLVSADRLVIFCETTGFVLAWSIGLATATQVHPVALLAASPWLIFYLVIVSGPVVGTPVAAVPLLWLAWSLCRSLVRVPRRWVFVITWAIAVALVSYPLPGVSGFRRALGWSFGSTWWFTGVLLFVAGLVLVRVRGRAPMPRFGTMLTGSLLTSAALVVATTWRNAGQAVEGIELAFDDASAIVVLLFMWTSGRFAEEAFNLTSWTLRQSARLLPARLVPALVLSAMGAVTTLEVIRVAAPERDVLIRSVSAAHAIVGILSIGLFVWWWRRRTASTPRVLLLAISWLAGWGMLQGLLALATATAESRQVVGQLSGAGLVITAAGLAFDLGKMAHPSRHDVPEKLYLPLGSMTIASLSAVCLLLVAGDAWEMRRSLMVLTGALHLGIPMAVARAGRSMAGLRAPSTGPCLTFFATGYGCAIGILLLEPRQTWALLAAFPVLALLLRWVSRAHPSIGADGAALVGALFGGGLVGGWMMPYPPTLPFLPRPAWIELLRDWASLGRPPLTLAHAALLVSAWLVGALLGWMWFRRRRLPLSS